MKKSPQTEKRFIIRKYVMAHSARQALIKESHVQPDDVYIDSDWANKNEFEGNPIKGFSSHK